MYVTISCFINIPFWGGGEFYRSPSREDFTCFGALAIVACVCDEAGVGGRGSGGGGCRGRFRPKTGIFFCENMFVFDLCEELGFYLRKLG